MSKPTKKPKAVPYNRYVIQVEGPIYYRHDALETREQILNRLLKLGHITLQHITRDGAPEPYGVLKLGYELLVLTWREFEAAKIKPSLVIGLEKWRDPNIALVEPEPERPKKERIEDPSDPVETFLGAELPDRIVETAGHDGTGRQLPPLKTPDPDVTATPKLLAALAEMPGGVNTDTLACKVYGDASVRSKSKLYNLLSYHTRKKTVRKTKLGLWKLQDMVERAADAILDAQVGL